MREQPDGSHIERKKPGINMTRHINISESDWASIQETLYLSGMPGMVETHVRQE